MAACVNAFSTSSTKNILKCCCHVEGSVGCEGRWGYGAWGSAGNWWLHTSRRRQPLQLAAFEHAHTTKSISSLLKYLKFLFLWPVRFPAPVTAVPPLHAATCNRCQTHFRFASPSPTQQTNLFSNWEFSGQSLHLARRGVAWRGESGDWRLPIDD